MTETFQKREVAAATPAAETAQAQPATAGALNAVEIFTSSVAVYGISGIVIGLVAWATYKFRNKNKSSKGY